MVGGDHVLAMEVFGEGVSPTVSSTSRDFVNLIHDDSVGVFVDAMEAKAKQLGEVRASLGGSLQGLPQQRARRVELAVMAAVAHHSGLGLELLTAIRSFCAMAPQERETWVPSHSIVSVSFFIWP